MFKHETVVLPEVTTKNISGKRFYLTPEGNKYPSITTVLNGRKAEGLFEWRKRVGNDVANHVMRTAASRGTKVHQMCEDYLNNNFDETKHKKDFLPYCLFKELSAQLLCKIDMIRSQECGLYSDKYKVAGRVDCIAEYDGVLSIIDFKTSRRERNDDWNENYYIQGSAYAEMFEERTSQPINQVVILVVTEDGTVQEFIKDKTEYLPLLEEAVSVFNLKEQESEKLTA